MTAAYPGIFDPVTNVHLDIIRRASRVADGLVVAVAALPAGETLFTAEERLDMVRRAASGIPNVRVAAFDGTGAGLAAETGASVVIRALTGLADLEHGMQLAMTRSVLAPGTETLFFAADPGRACPDPAVLRKIALRGGDVSAFVPPEAVRAFNGKRRERRKKD